MSKNTTTRPASYDYKAFSQLTGAFSKLPKGPYKVAYERLTSKGNATKALSLIIANFIIEIGFITWLSFAIYSHFTKPFMPITTGLIVIVVGIFIIEIFRLVSMFNLCVATLASKNPVPVRPEKGKRVAFTTTIVPSKEPFSMVEKTLKAMLKVKYDGKIDVWLLDEGNDKAIQKACKQMGVKHFSRKDIEKWNTAKGRFKAKTKHGNHNAWLDAHGADYDYVLSVDSDHVPLPNFAQRLLGYFRDPNVAFVVGPQVYGNFDNTITKGAESQSYIFQAAVQRAGNSYDSAMFVGTNHAYRVKAWEQIDGFQDSITEDMLTGMEIHSRRNPKTNKFWKSVYTPDVVAVGEGPSSWTDFFTQQFRWARGGNEVFVKNFLAFLFRLPWRAKFYYSMLAGYYPMVALGWITGATVTVLFLILGEAGVDIGSKIWFALYFDVLAAQILLYAWMRKYNVSPHEERGTLGVPGMFVSMLCAPIYASAFIATLLRRKASFVVTAKGSSASPDRLMTFRKHLTWGMLFIGCLVYSAVVGNSYPEVKIWSVSALAVCFVPIIMWAFTLKRPTLKLFKNRNKVSSIQEAA
jgi:cellulose synthase/poly-beta-1,6-N-acetylglucosamine synthase-like glycosyltransferase